MSEVQKPIEETPIVLAAEPVAPATEPVLVPVIAETPSVQPTTAVTTETPVVASTEPAKSVAPTEAKTEGTKPVEEGTLGYKAPGLIKYVHFLPLPALNIFRRYMGVTVFCDHLTVSLISWGLMFT